MYTFVSPGGFHISGIRTSSTALAQCVRKVKVDVLGEFLRYIDPDDFMEVFSRQRRP